MGPARPDPAQHAHLLHTHDRRHGPLLQRLDRLAVVPRRRLLHPHRRRTAQAQPRPARPALRPSLTAGDPVSYGYDPAARTYTLTYTTRANTDGPTEIAVPRDVYPDGYNVAVQGRNADWDRHGQTLTVATRGRTGGTYTVTLTPR
ncbi:hypothetical protein ACU686_00690 [Yinghuangia aomiensis]